MRALHKINKIESKSNKNKELSNARADEDGGRFISYILFLYNLYINK